MMIIFPVNDINDITLCKRSSVYAQLIVVDLICILL